MRKIFFILVVSLSFIFSAQADYDVNRLLDSYLVAKADTVKAPITDAEAQKNPFTIQVASYVNEKDAVSHVEELKVQEKEVFYYPAFVRGTVWYKVCVGKFSERTNAEDYRKKFVKRMDEPFSVVISLLDRPSQRQVASETQKETAPKHEKETAPAPKTQKEVTPVPHGDHHSASADAHAPAPMTVTLHKKDDKTKMVVEEKMTPVADAHAVKGHTVQTIAANNKETHSVTSATATHMATTTTHTTEPSSGANYYSVQVGAFPNEKLAQDTIAKWAQDGIETFIRAADVNGKTWYRAFLGKFDNHQAAKNYQQTLSEKSPGVDSFIRKMK